MDRAARDGVLKDIAAWTGKADSTTADEHERLSVLLRIKYGHKPRSRAPTAAPKAAPKAKRQGQGQAAPKATPKAAPKDTPEAAPPSGKRKR